MELDAPLRQKVADYQSSPQNLLPIQYAPMLLLAGISGAGKDAMIQTILRTYSTQYTYLLSHITRAPRKNDGVMEQDGVEYHFIDFKEAERMLDKGEYIEANIVHHKDIYGTAIAMVKSINDAGKIAITDVTIDGVADYIRLGLHAKPIFLLPPSYEVWQERLHKREGDRMEVDYYKHRLQSARREISQALATDYFYIVLNDTLSDTAKLINDIAHDAPIERHSPKGIAAAKHLLAQVEHDLSTLDA